MSAVGNQRPVDLVHLSRYTGGDAALNAEILQLFDTQADELVARLQILLDAGDQKGWHAVNHSIKGAARGIGAFALADAAAAAEHLDPASNADLAKTALVALKDKALSVQLFIKAYLDR
jgi:HPt (histidine-containing phosphotransfer) domain-containing protein